MLESMLHRDRLLNVSKAVGCVLLTYHLFALTITNLSTTTVLRGHLHRWVRPYVGTFGLWQAWDMFTTIPYYANLRGKLVAEFHDGSTREFDPLLPGLEPAPPNLKITSAMSRLMWSRKGFEKNVSQWEQTMCNAVEQATGSRPKTVQLALSAERLNALAQVRATGSISHPEQFKTRAAVCKH